ncbi:isoprenylcysteine carboxylmethyltransferase family protein [Noviherbaspirillum agri]
MKLLELRIPPLLLVLIMGMLMWFAAMLLPAAAISIPWRTMITVALGATGASIALAGVLAFRRAHTTVNPTTPDASSTVVASGIYRRTRNPMYLGFLFMLAGWGVFLSSVASLLFLPLFILYMNRFQIRPEERALRAKFGTQYGAYMQEVRRWL